MPEYRLYKIAMSGHIKEPPTSHELPDDRAAVAHAKQILDDYDIEIWQGARVVAYLTPNDNTRLP
jgi:hypothetical protein